MIACTSLGRNIKLTDYNLKSFQKILAILDCFSPIESTLSVSEIAERSRLPRSTAHRLIQSLRQIGLLDQDGMRHEYRLGMKLFELGSSVLSTIDLQKEARIYVEMLSRASGQAVHLCMFDGWRVVFINKTDGGRANALNSTIVMEASPCHCTGVGKAALAFQPQHVVDRVVKLGLTAYTRNTITDPKVFRDELATIRKRGYALDFGELDPSERCVAAPIRDSSGRVIAALSATGTDKKLSTERLHELAPTVIEHASLISSSIGWSPEKVKPIGIKSRQSRAQSKSTR